jgi:hypothetical protein
MRLVRQVSNWQGIESYQKRRPLDMEGSWDGTVLQLEGRSEAKKGTSDQGPLHRTSSLDGVFARLNNDDEYEALNNRG